MDSSSDSVGDILSAWASIREGRSPATVDRQWSSIEWASLGSFEHKPHTYLKGVKTLHGSGSDSSFEKHAIFYLILLAMKGTIWSGPQP